MKIKPLWRWKPSCLRKLALLLYLPLWVIYEVVGLVILVVVGAVIGIYEHLSMLQGWRAGVVWCRATWRGDHVGIALAAYFNGDQSHEDAPK